MNQNRLIHHEIGSEFWEVPTSKTGGVPLPEQTKWFISGTAALTYIISDLLAAGPLNRAALPSWCCSCMIHPFLRAGVEVLFYSVYVNSSGRLAVDYSSVPECDATLVLPYFGYSDYDVIGTPTGKTIVDLTHGIFSKTTPVGDYTFGSLRKWAGFYTGGFALKNGDWQTTAPILPADEGYLGLRKRAMDEKLQYLTGRRDDKAYLDLFEQGEDFLDTCSCMGSCEQDAALIQRLDVDFIRSRRRENASVLLAALSEYALFPKLSEDDCPLFVPLILPEEERSALRRYLISQEIYCPIHWPVSDLHRLTAQQLSIYQNEISLVCDQRYTVRDMERIIHAVKTFKTMDR
ncbi:MAG: hypothetical protein E7328_00995 [Clostridiales bacterium]|nr:hypothetical protein [Clostridiales bacterium]